MNPIIIFILIFQLNFINACVSDSHQTKVEVQEELSPKERITEIAALPKGLKESSGLAITEKGTLISHNDSGGKSELIEFSKDGELIRKIDIIDEKNYDWEELAEDDENIYIGDTGNNSGRRKNLMVYIVSKKEIENDNKVKAKKIKFLYPEQTDFNIKRHNFDCEAMFALDGHLYLFTKNRGDSKCSLYRIPAEKGEYTAHFVSSFDTKGLITSADISPDRKKVVLTGYNHVGVNGFEPFIWKLTNFTGKDFFSGNSKRFDFSFNRQIEAVCFEDNNHVLFTEEEEHSLKGYLYRMKI